jgi:hypothetical protein
MGARSSVGQSSRLITDRSQVRALAGPWLSRMPRGAGACASRAAPPTPSRLAYSSLTGRFQLRSIMEQQR